MDVKDLEASVNNLMDRGQLRMKMGDLEGAIAEMDDVIRIFPEYYPAYYNKAVMYKQLGKRDESIENYKVVIELEPLEKVDGVEVLCATHHNLGLIYLEQRKYEESITCFHNAIMVNCEVPEIYTHRSTARLRIGDYAGALSDLERALEIKDTHESSVNLEFAKKMIKCIPQVRDKLSEACIECDEDAVQAIARTAAAALTLTKSNKCRVKVDNEYLEFKID